MLANAKYYVVIYCIRSKYDRLILFIVKAEQSVIVQWSSIYESDKIIYSLIALDWIAAYSTKIRQGWFTIIAI